MSKPQVLFVDDSNKLLSGLRRMLHDQRSEWDMFFCDSGAEALQFVKNHKIDVVVSDMRMPNMDGAQLLTEIQKIRPNTKRIILSGYAEMETVLKTVGPSHQYLAKPCDPALLKESITLASNLKMVLEKCDLRELVSGLSTLPMLPDTFRSFSTMIAQTHPDITEIASIVKRDISFSAQLLKLTNSAYFSIPQEIYDIEQALKFLGTETLRSLLFIDGFFAAFDGNDSQQTKLVSLNSKANLLGRLSERICLSSGLGEDDSQQAYIISMLSNIGATILLCYRSVEYDACVSLIEKKGMSQSCAANTVFGTTFSAINMYVLGLWGFSKNIVNLVSGLDDPCEIQNVMNPQSAVKISAALLQRHQALERSDPEAELYALEVLFGTSNLSSNQISLWESMYEELIDDPRC